MTLQSRARSAAVTMSRKLLGNSCASCDIAVGQQWQNPGDLVHDPFAGVGTVPLVALQMGRRGSGAELNPGYWRDSVRYLRSEEMRLSAPTLFDVLGGESA